MTTPLPRVVGCLIVKDERRYLEECVRSMRAVCDRVVIVDTGSTDGTVEIARRLADVVAECPFDGDFSQARNVALDLVEDADWVLFLDADERIHSGQLEPLRAALRSASPDVGGITLLRYNFFPSGGFYTGRVLKLFRHRPDVRYERKVNESVKGSLRAAGLRVVDSECLLTHIGHCRPRAERDAKALRYMELMTSQLADAPHDAVLTAYVGLNLRLFGRVDEAVEWTRRALAIDDGLAVVWAFHGHVLRARGEVDESIKAYQEGLARQPDDLSLLNMVGVSAASTGDLDRAQAVFGEVARTGPALVHAVVNQGLVAQARGDHDTAVERFTAAANAFPPLLTEEPVLRLEADPFACLYFETVTGYAGLGHHLAYAMACAEGRITPSRVNCAPIGAGSRG
jgi:tetratricopeptide (TPR) repeat protein